MKNELRIGNWVYEEVLGRCKIETIGEGCTGVTAKHLDNKLVISDRYYKMHLSNLQPIPLTEEWLQKFGFKEVSIKYELWNLRSHGFTFQIARKSKKHKYVFRFMGMTVINCEHVHQFQNLYWCLTGDELTIK